MKNDLTDRIDEKTRLTGRFYVKTMVNCLWLSKHKKITKHEYQNSTHQGPYPMNLIFHVTLIPVVHGQVMMTTEPIRVCHLAVF